MGIISSDLHTSTPQTTKPLPRTLPKEDPIYIYINKDGNPSTIRTRHVKANVNTLKENQNDQNSSNEGEDLMLQGLQIVKPPFWQFLSKFLGQSFLLSLH
jgi:hypothetical protein